MVVDNLSVTLTALSDPTRRAILDRLACGPATVNSIAAPFRLSQQAISKHLAYLDRAQLIEKRRKGRQQVCALKADSLNELIGWAENCQKTWYKRFDRLDQVLVSMKKEKRMEKDEFIITRIFNAPREMVFKAWTDPVYVKQWWGPTQFTSPYCTIDFRVGGKFRFCMRGPDGNDYWNVGIYEEIIVPEKIVTTMHFADKDGNIVPASHYFGNSDFPSVMVDLVKFEIYEREKTKLTICRNHSLDLANKFGEIQGWNQSLDKFAKAVEKPDFIRISK